MTLISTNLFEQVLFAPASEGADQLLIVSGYATANMVVRHSEYLRSNKLKFDVNLIVGMCSKDGLEFQNHNLFKQLQADPTLNFNCNYIIDRPPVHSKVYTWLMQGEPYKTFIGSANYTQNGFSSSMREVLSTVDPSFGRLYYDSLIGETINCLSDEVPNQLELYRRERIIRDQVDFVEGEAIEQDYDNLPKVTLTLLDRSTDETPTRSGLNWGQRPGRDHNQAYINIPSLVRATDFFPERERTFMIITDDHKEFICVRAQDGGKGLETPRNNAELGMYFRYRLGLASGEYVTKQHLLNYGRTDVDFYKIDNETYYLNFSV